MIAFLLGQHYTELPDIKRVIVNTHAIEPQVNMPHCFYFFRDFFFNIMIYLFQSHGLKMLSHVILFLQSLVEFFGTLSREWALECMKDLLLVNLRGNLQIIVQVWKYDFFSITLN